MIVDGKRSQGVIWQGRRLRTERSGFYPQPRQDKYFLLFSVGCFGAYEIHLQVFAGLLQIPSTPPFTDVHRSRLHEGKLKHEDLFGSLTVYVSLYTIMCVKVNRGPMGQA